MAGNGNSELEKRLWDAADELRANSKLKSSEYAVPVLGLIFLRYADHKFSHAEKQIQSKASGRRKIGKADYQALGVMFLPDNARFSYLVSLPESTDHGKKINEAMKAIEEENPDLKDVLPKSYALFEKKTLIELIKVMNSIPMDIEGDAFGKIYEYFLGNFAMKEGQKGGEFFTPTSLVKLIVEIIEPYHGRIYDPACGSGGMFVQSARFVENHKKNPSSEISVYGQERITETVRLCKMNLAVHGLSGDIRETNTYYEDIHKCVGKFDFVMANPPFNVDRVDKERIAKDPRFPLGMPSLDNANFLWIQLFFSALNDKGRAGFVMANSAADARASEQLIRKQIIESGVIDVLIGISPNFFYTVTLPCMLWFFDKAKKESPRKDKILFIDARQIFEQTSRAQRAFTSQQVEFIANIVRLYRKESIENTHGSKLLMERHGLVNGYTDVEGLCRVADITEIEKNSWSLSPGRYVGIIADSMKDADFYDEIERLSEEFQSLTSKAHELEEFVKENLGSLMEKGPNGTSAN